MIYKMKPVFEERMRTLMPNKEDFDKFNDIIHIAPRNFIRCNTIKIKPDELLFKLEEKWKIFCPFSTHKEIMLVESELNPGELGNALEHILGYYYIQEVSSMMSVIALDPKPQEFILDIAASPGSKTTQIAAAMQNSGTLIANDIKVNRISILVANLERCGVTNTIVTRMDGIALCDKLSNHGFLFDKILLDAPCSGDGTLRSSPKTFYMWNLKVVNNFSRMQKKMIAYAIKCLKVGGILVYSTCSHSPEENESVINFAIKNFPIIIESVNLPLKCRPGIKRWKNEEFNDDIAKVCRIYPQDNDSEGFFVARLRLIDKIK